MPVFALQSAISNASAMLTADEILAELERRKVSRAALAQALGVQQPNATRLYKPDPRSGRTRALGWDEGWALVDKFKLAIDPAGHEPCYFNEALLLPIVSEIAAAARRDRSDEAVAVLTTALARYLEQLDTKPAIRASQDALEAVAQAAVPQVRQSKH